MRAAPVVIAILLAGCHHKPPIVQPSTVVTIKEPVEVRIPVPVPVQPPAELLAPINVPLPIFIAPSDPNASSALDAQGERNLRGLLAEYQSRLEAIWKYWATLLKETK